MTLEIALTLFTLAFKLYLDFAKRRKKAGLAKPPSFAATGRRTFGRLASTAGASSFNDVGRRTLGRVGSIALGRYDEALDLPFEKTLEKFEEEPSDLAPCNTDHQFCRFTAASDAKTGNAKTLPPAASDPRYRGFHVLLDYSGFATQDPQSLSDWMMATLRDALDRHKVRCVHSHSEVFPIGNPQSPPGFAMVCLLDESHASAHCYSDRGMLAIDVFSCGGRPDVTHAIAADVHAAVLAHLPGVEFMGSGTYRFPLRICDLSASTVTPSTLEEAEGALKPSTATAKAVTAAPADADEGAVAVVVT